MGRTGELQCKEIHWIGVRSRRVRVVGAALAIGQVFARWVRLGLPLHTWSLFVLCWVLRFAKACSSETPSSHCHCVVVWFWCMLHGDVMLCQIRCFFVLGIGVKRMDSCRVCSYF